MTAPLATDLPRVPANEHAANAQALRRQIAEAMKLARNALATAAAYARGDADREREYRHALDKVIDAEAVVGRLHHESCMEQHHRLVVALGIGVGSCCEPEAQERPSC